MATNELIRKRVLGDDMTESFSSVRTARSMPPKGVLGLGRHLVYELGLEDSNDTLGRWLAHHLAELMTEAKNAKSAAARRVASRQAADLILKIWDHRTVLPHDANPLAQYRGILMVLSRLRPEANPWQRRTEDRIEGVAAGLYHSFCRLISTLLALNLPANAGKRNLAASFLSKEEVGVLAELERLFEFVAVVKGEVSPEQRSHTSEVPTDTLDVVSKLIQETAQQLQEPALLCRQLILATANLAADLSIPGT